MAAVPRRQLFHCGFVGDTIAGGGDFVVLQPRPVAGFPPELQVRCWGNSNVQATISTHYIYLGLALAHAHDGIIAFSVFPSHDAYPGPHYIKGGWKLPGDGTCA